MFAVVSVMDYSATAHQQLFSPPLACCCCVTILLPSPQLYHLLLLVATRWWLIFTCACCHCSLCSAITRWAITRWAITASSYNWYAVAGSWWQPLLACCAGAQDHSRCFLQTLLPWLVLLLLFYKILFIVAVAIMAAMLHLHCCLVASQKPLLAASTAMTPLMFIQLHQRRPEKCRI